MSSYHISYKTQHNTIERDNRRFASLMDARGYASAFWRQESAQSVGIYKDGELVWLRTRGQGTRTF